jgi:hypothetical protein
VRPCAPFPAPQNKGKRGRGPSANNDRTMNNQNSEKLLTYLENKLTLSLEQKLPYDTVVLLSCGSQPMKYSLAMKMN